MVHALGAGHDLIGVQAEGQKHGLLQPLVNLPLAVDLFSNPRGAAVQQGDALFDGLTRGAGRGVADLGTGVPGGFDGSLQVGEGRGHGLTLLKACADQEGRQTRGAVVNEIGGGV